MGIGKRIKEAREHLKLTQNELGDLIGVTGSSVTNYEKETSHPKEQILYKLIEVLQVDANYLFQDCVKFPSQGKELTLDEKKILNQYNTLDEHGREIVDFIIDKEAKRATIEQMDMSSFSTITPIANHLKVNAAHERTDIEVSENMKEHDDNIMNDDSLWDD